MSTALTVAGIKKEGRQTSQEIFNHRAKEGLITHARLLKDGKEKCPSILFGFSDGEIVWTTINHHFQRKLPHYKPYRSKLLSRQPRA